MSGVGGIVRCSSRFLFPIFFEKGEVCCATFQEKSGILKLCSDWFGSSALDLVSSPFNLIP